jgi:hypothetical protein
MNVLLKQSEKAIYEECCELLRVYNFAVYRLAQPRRSMQSLGIPDLYAMHGNRGAIWMECKTDVGKQTAYQKSFQNRCISAGVPYVVGAVPELAYWLKTGEILPWPRAKS